MTPDIKKNGTRTWVQYEKRGFTVVPMLAPMMMPKAWIRLMSEFTMPMVMIMVALENCRITVKIRPNNMELTYF